MFGVLTATDQKMDVAPGDTVHVLEPNPHHVVCVVPSFSNLTINPAIDSPRCFCLNGFFALWASPKPMISLTVKTQPKVEYILRSPVPPLVFSCAIDISPFRSPPLNDTIGCNTDSIEMKDFVVLLREADGIEKLDKQVKEVEDELSRLRKSLNLQKTLRNNC